MFTVANHRIKEIPYKPAYHIGGIISPDLIVVHDTAGRLEKGNSARYLQGKNPSSASVHLIVERDGSAEQQVPFNRKANHAGISSYNGRDYCNGFSIGIEFVNAGRMSAGAQGQSVAWYKQTFNNEKYGIKQIDTKEHGKGNWWMDYTPEQIATGYALVQAIKTKYGSQIKDLQPHWYISPRRKVDTNPQFPLAAFRSIVLGRDNNESDAIEDKDSKVVAGSQNYRIVTPSGLNMRRWPSFNPNIILSIPTNAVVPVIRSGMFNDREWAKVSYNGEEGWIVTNPAYVQSV